MEQAGRKCDGRGMLLSFLTMRSIALAAVVAAGVVSVCIHGSVSTIPKVRELQAAGQAGPDVPTNLYFFFEVQALSMAR